MPDAFTPKQIVVEARALERMVARRRRLFDVLATLNDTIKLQRMKLRDMTEQDATRPYELLPGEEPRS